MKTLALVVGGGPAPGINAVIAAATIEARNAGLRVLGIREGFRALLRGELDRARELAIPDVSRIHFDGGSILGTSRVNPARTPEDLRRVVEALERLDVSYLLTIGGDDTAFGAGRVAEAMAGRLTTAHVPKTIDNDLPLPAEIPTFGHTTAVDFGKTLVQNLMQDAATTGRWFFVTVMGRHAGHLTLGIAGAAGATLAVIAEEFPDTVIELDRVAAILEGAIIKRRASGHTDGVALLAEGLLEKFDPATLGPVERDGYGNVRLGELELARLLKARVSASLSARGIEGSIVAKDLGYELRCTPPSGFDIQYCRSLGYWAVRFLLDGGTEALVTIQAGKLVPIEFGDLRDPVTGRVRVRYVDVTSEAYQTLCAYMIRLTADDLGDPARVRALAAAGALSEAEFVERFGRVAGPAPTTRPLRRPTERVRVSGGC
jgi:6-phosphofructokinase 1